MNKKLVKTLLEEFDRSTVDITNFNFWISPDGEVYNVSFGNHIEFICNHLGTFAPSLSDKGMKIANALIDETWAEDDYDAEWSIFDELFKKGWVRVDAYDSEAIAIDLGGVASIDRVASLIDKHIVSLYKNSDGGSFEVEGPLPGSSTTVSVEFKDALELGFKKAYQQAKRIKV